MSITLDGEAKTITVNGQVLKISAGLSVVIPSGNTLQRPAIPITGMIRFNNQIGKIEGYNGNVWGNIGI